MQATSDNREHIDYTAAPVSGIMFDEFWYYNRHLHGH